MQDHSRGRRWATGLEDGRSTCATDECIVHCVSEALAGCGSEDCRPGARAGWGKEMLTGIVSKLDVVRIRSWSKPASVGPDPGEHRPPKTMRHQRRCLWSTLDLDKDSRNGFSPLSQMVPKEKNCEDTGDSTIVSRRIEESQTIAIRKVCGKVWFLPEAGQETSKLRLD
ncbi:hypothetical protein M405DRAFT_883433 [Rhizopogon salebrosus TDB-379]|nr:hypothetical protein M405DRAFT_883433 [Rhizopogon salebrosus TDB-379]